MIGEKMSFHDIPGRRERKRNQTLDRLAAAAFHLFESHGYDVVTMEQIAAAADVAKGTLYNHFPVKEALLAHWIHTELAADLKCLLDDMGRHAGFVSRMSLLLDASADWCQRHRTYLPHYLRFRFLSIDGAAADQEGAGRNDMDRAFEVLIGEGQRSGELRDDLAAPHLAILFHHLYLGALLRWLTIPGLTLGRELEIIVKLFVEGARRPTGLNGPPPPPNPPPAFSF